MKVVKKTGLVPVLSLQTGAVTGMKPDLVRDLLQKKLVELVPIPDGIETFEALAAIASPAPEAAREVLVEIPDGWERLHFLKQIKIAREIAGYDQPPEGRQAKEYAYEILSAEVERRSGEAQPPEE